MNTVVLGASTNPSRYAHKAGLLLQEMNLPVFLVGIREGKIGDKAILTGQPAIADVHTVTLYIGEDKQAPLVDYIISLKPKRVIFNPGTENFTAIRQLKAVGIAIEIACTLVLLRTGQYLTAKDA